MIPLNVVIVTSLSSGRQANDLGLLSLIMDMGHIEQVHHAHLHLLFEIILEIRIRSKSSPTNSYPLHQSMLMASHSNPSYRTTESKASNPTFSALKDVPLEEIGQTRQGQLRPHRALLWMLWGCWGFWVWAVGFRAVSGGGLNGHGAAEAQASPEQCVLEGV